MFRRRNIFTFLVAATVALSLVPAAALGVCSLDTSGVAFTGLEQAPVAESQVPASWQVSIAGQTTGLPPVQIPA